MFEKVADAEFIRGEHSVLRFWAEHCIFDKLREQNQDGQPWSFLDGPITANNPMGVHHAWGRTFKDAYQRYYAMNGRQLRYQNGFDCQGLWVEVEVEKELGQATRKAILDYGIDRFVNACKQRVLNFAARQTEQSVRLGYWMDWDDPETLRKLAENIGTGKEVTVTTPGGQQVTERADWIVERLGNPEWGGSYFTFSTENNETIWTFLKKCFDRQKIYRGHDVMPWSGRSGSAYSQMEVADGRRLTTHKSCFARFPLTERDNEFLLVWTTTPWTLTSNVAAAVNPELDYVKLQAKKDGAVYYFAAENLEFQRLEKEFKENFGRPEWKWPKDVPKLKTIAQIFKEQGGFENLGTVKGAEMVGWKYAGPFDELPAQQQPGGVPKEESLKELSGVSCHQVIDGGRDSRGNPHVVAGEGTGIVHIAPGCGDVDHQLGQERGLVGIAPLAEDGTFIEGFGPFTGKEAIDRNTAEMVFDSLKEKGHLVYVETYPHIYPHCWRTGDELVFRLVDEWFINMDWREEIKEVTREIDWLPESVDGQERELEWLTNMRDWMISKKRFWGLALPIWVDEETGDFEVIGSLAELKDRAVEGWDEFEGHSPHRPWIDKVKIKNEKTGNSMTRIPDVGNPWLDAGITPFSTMHYNTDHDAWQTWYPADFVTECFPGQFRNWFYSLLALATMMRYDETEDPVEKRPFKTLLGHRLVMDEDGNAMHKSDGTAIWFEEAAEQLGVDTIRWMYLAQNPAVDLRFGRRHPDERVTLQTPEGEISETAEGLEICLVTSKPSDAIRRQILIPLWNSYTFFVNYAALDEFDPNQPVVPVSERPEIDRWVLSNLQSLVDKVRTAFDACKIDEACTEIAAFIDDLSNWYIRRNRRRFWRSKDASDTDKLAAYQTLHEVLVALTKLQAPMIPFLAERMYQNLVFGRDISDAVATADGDQPLSVHLCPYPTVDETLSDPELNDRMATAQNVVRLGHKLREEANQRVRQPLAELRYVCSNVEAHHISALADVISDELNIEQLTRAEDLDDLVSYSFKPNLKTLGPKYGKLLGLLRQKLPEMEASILAPLRRGENVTIDIDGKTIELTPGDVLITTEQASDWASGDDQNLQIALSTQLTPELVRKGMSRDFVRQVQQLRKEAGLEIQDRITVFYISDSDDVQQVVEEYGDYIRNETLADDTTLSGETVAGVKSVAIGNAKAAIWIERA